MQLAILTGIDTVSCYKDTNTVSFDVGFVFVAVALCDMVSYITMPYQLSPIG
jgi:hypothetical protein